MLFEGRIETTTQQEYFAYWWFRDGLRNEPLRQAQRIDSALLNHQRSLIT